MRKHARLVSQLIAPLLPISKYLRGIVQLYLVQEKVAGRPESGLALFSLIIRNRHIAMGTEKQP